MRAMTDERTEGLLQSTKPSRFTVRVLGDDGQFTIKELHETASDAIRGAQEANQQVRLYAGPGEFASYYRAFDGDKPIEE